VIYIGPLKPKAGKCVKKIYIYIYIKSFFEVKVIFTRTTGWK